PRHAPPSSRRRITATLAAPRAAPPFPLPAFGPFARFPLRKRAFLLAQGDASLRSRATVRLSRRKPAGKNAGRPAPAASSRPPLSPLRHPARHVHAPVRTAPTAPVAQRRSPRAPT